MANSMNRAAATPGTLYSGRRPKKGVKVKPLKSDVAIRTVSTVLLVFLVILTIVPLLNYFSLAFSDPTYNNEIILFPTHWDGSSFAYVFSGKYPGFWRSFLNSVIITVVVTIVSNLVEAMAAYPLSKPDCPFRKGILLYFVITMLFSAGTVPIYLLMRSFGLLNSIWSIVLISISNVSNLLFYKNFFESIPKEVEEAGMIDGASSLRMFFQIIVPMSLPVFGSCCFFSIVGMWNGYGSALIFISSSAENAMPLAYYLFIKLTEQEAQSMYDPFLQTHLANIQAAALLISIIPILCIYPYVIKYIKGGATVGSVKG